MSARHRILTFSTPAGPRAGIAVADSVYDTALLLGDEKYASTLSIFADWTTTRDALSDASDRLVTEPTQARTRSLKNIELLPPIMFPGDIYCAGANYSDHIDEMNRAMKHAAVRSMKDAGEEAWHFVRAGRSTIAGPNAVIELPRYSSMVDWEIELAVVIGRTARHVEERQALEYVAGYTIANDLSVRDLARRGIPEGSPFHFDFLKAKSFHGSCPIGPWITPAAAIADPQNLAMKLWLNDELMQNSSTALMISGVAEQIATLSRRITLYPGDLVLTGTPAGVGVARGRFLAPGDSIRLWVEDIGELRHTIASSTENPR